MGSPVSHTSPCPCVCTHSCRWTWMHVCHCVHVTVRSQPWRRCSSSTPWRQCLPRALTHTSQSGWRALGFACYKVIVCCWGKLGQEFETETKEGHTHTHTILIHMQAHTHVHTHSYMCILWHAHSTQSKQMNICLQNIWKPVLNSLCAKSVPSELPGGAFPLI